MLAMELTTIDDVQSNLDFLFIVAQLRIRYDALLLSDQ